MCWWSTNRGTVRGWRFAGLSWVDERPIRRRRLQFEDTRREDRGARERTGIPSRCQTLHPEVKRPTRGWLVFSTLEALLPCGRWADAEARPVPSSRFQAFGLGGHFTPALALRYTVAHVASASLASLASLASHTCHTLASVS